MDPLAERILVTRPFFPPIDDVLEEVREVWCNQWLTNFGPKHEAFQEALQDRLAVDRVALFANGTLAMELGLRAMHLPDNGEVITAPFTFVATANAIVNAGLTPMFVDIRLDNYTIDPCAVKAAITDNTVAIAPVHVFGMPCDHSALQAIAQEHGLKLFYDAAHCFGMEVNGQCIGSLGDMSMFSLHATKFFHSVEGGMLVSSNSQWLEEATALANFGLREKDGIEGRGTNAKMSELHAAVGRVNLEHLDELLDSRRHQVMLYREQLDGRAGIRLLPLPGQDVKYNFSFMPVEISPAEFGCDRDTLQARLEEHDINTRKYFYPLLTDTEAFAGSRAAAGPLPNARHAASRVLCLPLYHGLTDDQIRAIAMLIQEGVPV